MLKEVTFRLNSSPVSERIEAELQDYSRWAQAVEAFGSGAWRTQAA